MSQIIKLKNGRTYRVAPSQFGGRSVVEVVASGTSRPVRNLKERAAVFAAADAAAPIDPQAIGSTTTRSAA